MMLKSFTLSAFISALAVPALALSCVPHEVTDTYQRLDAAPEQYVPVHGRLTFDESRAPKVDWENQQDTPPNTYIPARIKGKSLSRNGFTRDFDAPLTLNLQCIGPWCVTARSGEDMLAFLERKPDGSYALALHACGGDGFLNPSRAQLHQVKTCYNGGSCKAKYAN